MNDIIIKIRNQFLTEAVSSPLLFNDLANMEKYISESYSGRSLIELIQNADDACAENFYIELLDKKTYIVANDGREFTNNDMLSLCRSGSSTKIRKDSTIGFRGIGFKSIVNYVETVHLVSGQIKTTFSKKITSELIRNNTNVPLVRIPHEFNGMKYDKDINRLKEKGYTTIFVFESINNTLSSEIEDYKSDCMLFLQSIKTVRFITNKKIVFAIKRKEISDSVFKVITDDRYLSNEWLVFRSMSSEEKCSIAFKYENGKVIDASTQESVIHSFMPTLDTLSPRIKINGDFSTDPSRTRVVIDEDTLNELQNCSEIIVGLLSKVLQSKSDELGLFNVMKKVAVNPLSNITGLSANDIFVEKIREKFCLFLKNMIGDEKKIYLQPRGVDDNDFIKIINFLGAVGFGNEDEIQIPGLLAFLKNVGIKEIPLEKCLQSMKEVVCSEITRATILANSIKETRFGMEKRLMEEICEAKLFQFQSGLKKISEVNENDTIELNFKEIINDIFPSLIDYNSFIKKIGLENNQLSIDNEKKMNCEHVINGKICNQNNIAFSKKKVIKKWRSVEENVAAVLQQINDIENVIDVSKQNLGYDLEAILKDGKKRFYEVKSVNDLGDLISITNNEYSTASQFKNEFFLAIAKQSDLNIEICFVKNPIENLHLSKRVTRWEWICEEYKGEIVFFEMENIKE